MKPHSIAMTKDATIRVPYTRRVYIYIYICGVGDAYATRVVSCFLIVSQNVGVPSCPLKLLSSKSLASIAAPVNIRRELSCCNEKNNEGSGRPPLLDTDGAGSSFGGGGAWGTV